MGGTFLSIDGDTLALRVFVGEDVVSQVKRLQRKACTEHAQDGDGGE